MADPFPIVFDLDGTLIDSAPDIHRTANIVFGRRGLAPFSLDTVRGFIGNGVGVLVTRLMAERGVDKDLHRELVDEFVKIYEEAVELTSLYPFVQEALQALADAGHPLGICTNKPLGPTRAVLRHFDLDRFFGVIIGGDSLDVRKPDPAPLLAAISAIGPGPALFVGDSEVDTETARAASVAFALFTEGYRKTAVADLPARLVFSSYATLPQTVQALGPRLLSPSAVRA